MAYIGWPEYASGRSSALYYFGIIGATLLVITLLHFSLKRREALREKREAEDALNMRRMKDDTGEVPAQTDNSPKGPTVSDRPEQTSCDDSRKDAD